MTRRELGFFILGAVVMIVGCSLASETSLEAGIGYANGKTAPDGIWWESQFPTSNRVNGFMYQIGVSHVSDNNIGVRADYTDLLRFSTDNVAIPDEHSVGAVIAGARNCAQGSQFCLAKWHGEGHAYGAHVGAFYDIHLGDWRFQPELGALLYHYRFGMQLEPLEAGALSGPVSEADGTGYGNGITPYARLTVFWKHAWARVDFNHDVKGHGGVVGIQEGPVVSALVGVAWRFQ